MSKNNTKKSRLHALEREILEPSAALISDMRKIEGDILILGVAGKMGPAMAKVAKRAVELAGVEKRIIGASRFSDPAVQAGLESAGVETIMVDLLDDGALQSLPEVPNIIYLAGNKFGTTGREPFTWAMNSYLPGRVCEKFQKSRIVAFSTGNVYPFAPISEGGYDESYPAKPVGEYGQSCLGRERLFQYFSEKYAIPVLIFRLNYAVDFRYGVLLEIAKSVRDDRPIDLRTTHVNVIWQGDANEMALRSLLHCETPAKVLNVTGPETISVEWLATQFGNLFGKVPLFEYEPQKTALLSNAAQAHRLFGYPSVSLNTMINLVYQWLSEGGELIEKPTHFQERGGKF